MDEVKELATHIALKGVLLDERFSKGNSDMDDYRAWLHGIRMDHMRSGSRSNGAPVKEERDAK